MNKLKILEIVNSHDIGGAETVLINILDNLDKDAYTPSVCIIGESPLRSHLIAKHIDVVGLSSYCGKNDFRFLSRLIKAVNKINPDIIHAHIWHTCFYASVAGCMLRIPVVSTFHSNYDIESYGDHLTFRTITYLSKRLVFVSRSQLEHFGLKNKTNFVSEKISIINNGVHIFDLDSNSDNNTPCNSLRDIFSRDKKELVITYVANLRPVKGHAYLIEAVQDLMQSGYLVRLFLVGDGSLKQELKKICEEKNIAERVVFLGYRNDVRKILRCSDIYISPSLSEANSMSIMEAMEAAKVVIASDVGGNRELIDEGETGFLVPAKNPSAIAGKVKEILKNPDVTARIGNNAREKIMRDFNVKDMTKKYEDVFSAMM